VITDSLLNILALDSSATYGEEHQRQCGGTVPSAAKHKHGETHRVWRSVCAYVEATPSHYVGRGLVSTEIVLVSGDTETQVYCSYMCALLCEYLGYGRCVMNCKGIVSNRSWFSQVRCCTGIRL
jgi:hypothetical protein